MVLTLVIGMFVSTVGAFVAWFSDARDAAVAAPAPSARVVGYVEGPRYTATPADLARTPAPITPDTPLVALTFDDGPTPERTPFVLDVLRAKGVRATFFFQGDQTEAYPDIARRALAEGHVVGLHSYEHAYFPDLDPVRAREQVVRAEEILTATTGVRPQLWRYPFGEASPAGDAVLAERGLVGNVGWDWDSDLPGDFECPGADAVTDYIVTEGVDRSVILLHDGGDAVTCPDGQWDYLPRAIDRLREQGTEFGVVVPSGRPGTLVDVAP